MLCSTAVFAAAGLQRRDLQKVAVKPACAEKRILVTPITSFLRESF